ncbi:MAG: hypothetical protein AAF333_04950 [Planctomycetota bacterium]
MTTHDSAGYRSTGHSAGLGGMSDGSFPTTIWSMVRDADHERTGVRTAALDELLRRYTPAMVRHLVRRKRLPADRAEDLVQGFITEKVLEKGLVGKADEARGKFRTLLLTALDRYIVSDFRARSAQKRGGGRVTSLEGLGAPVADPRSGPGGGSGGGAVGSGGDFSGGTSGNREADTFDIEWARRVLDQTLDAMKQECQDSDRPDLWGVFHDRLLGPLLDQAEPPGYDELVERHGIASPTQASNLLITGKRMFARTLRRVIADYAGEDDELIQREMDDLMQTLGRLPPA